MLNRLNFINFVEKTVLIELKHPKFDFTHHLHAKPQPCSGDTVECLWVGTPDLEQKLKVFEVARLLIVDDQSLVPVIPQVESVDAKSVRLILPERSEEICTRRVRRYPAQGIQARLSQNGAPFEGFLVDFSAVSFQVELRATPPQTFHWISAGSAPNLTLLRGSETLYSGECEIVRHSTGDETRTYVMKPATKGVHRFGARKYRSSRQKLVPSPNINFIHPITQKLVDLKIIDMSGTGFAVEEDMQSAILLPGMIIPQMKIQFSNTTKFTCKAQVVYSNPFEDNDEIKCKCGLVILDIAINDHLNYLSLLQQAQNPNSYISNTVEQDALWNFFFETGFIYPQKYASIQGKKEEFKQTYEKLYTQNPTIARHFIYQKNGKIYGHFAMLRFYEKTWINQHHAALKSGPHKAGLVVMSQLSRYINDAQNLYSAHMDFIAGYFRPNNRFPKRFFGGFTQKVADPKKCSIDPLAYFPFHASSPQAWDSTGPWEVARVQADDLRALESIYEKESGGLMLSALDLKSNRESRETLSEEYRKIGFRRENLLFSVKKNDDLKAIMMVNLSDIGLNMSDLTNCIHVFVLDPEDFPKERLFWMLSVLSVKFNQDEIPVLVYPRTYADSQSVPYEKTYNIWVLNLQHTDLYMEHMETLLQTAKYGI
ncbi:pilus assembly protein PilZ [Desulfuromonas sp.]|uniref:pilus assembly protein PilZ n=1 Tax=Desulfuromonas sp. TaxID=892 RepID=UPI0025C2A8F9|nr:pilus assembly protein PilZ [Desulfuromonas sp.]